MNIGLRCGLLIVAALFLQGCPPPTVTTTIFNNSSRDLVVNYQDGRQQPWPNGSAFVLGEVQKNQLAERRKRVKCPESVRAANCVVSFGILPVLGVSSADITWKYQLAFDSVVDPDLFDKKNWADYLQLERDGRLYAVKKPAQWPAQIPNPQRTPYPEEPESASSRQSVPELR